MSESASFWSFIQSVLSGETAPGPTHLWLIVLCIAGSAAVALGIIVESWPPKSCKAKVAMALVIGGVLCEGGFTVVLFTYDEAISHRQESTIEAQQSEIIALRKNALSRSIDVMSFAAVLSAAPPAKIEIHFVVACTDCDSLSFWLSEALKRADWPVEQPIPIASKDGSWARGVTSLHAQTSGITVVMNSPDKITADPKSSLGALMAALTQSLGFGYQGYDTAIQGAVDVTMPPDLIRIVVAPKA